MDGLAVLRQWLKDYQEAQKVVFKNVDDAAHLLVKELRSSVMEFVIDSYLSIHESRFKGLVQAMPLFLDEFYRCIERIIETFQGAGGSPASLVTRATLSTSTCWSRLRQMACNSRLSASRRRL